MNPGEYEAMFKVEDRHWWYVGLRDEIMRCLERYSPGKSLEEGPLRLLDAGCGTGGLLDYLRRVNGQRLIGMDIAWEGLERSKSRHLQNLLQGSVTGLPFKRDTFDVITNIDVLCHTTVDERKALLEFHRVLRPKGIVVFQVPAFEWLRSEHDTAVFTRKR